MPTGVLGEIPVSGTPTQREFWPSWGHLLDVAPLGMGVVGTSWNV